MAPASKSTTLPTASPATSLAIQLTMTPRSSRGGLMVVPSVGSTDYLRKWGSPKPWLRTRSRLASPGCRYASLEQGPDEVQLLHLEQRREAEVGGDSRPHRQRNREQLPPELRAVRDAGDPLRDQPHAESHAG